MKHIAGTMIQNTPKLRTSQTDIQCHLDLPRDNWVLQLVYHFRADHIQYKQECMTCRSMKTGFPEYRFKSVKIKEAFHEKDQKYRADKANL